MGIFRLRRSTRRKNSPVASEGLPWVLLSAALLALLIFQPMAAGAADIGAGPNPFGTTINVTVNPTWLGASPYTNNGTISIAGGGWLMIAYGEVLNNSGTGTLAIASGGYLYNGGGTLNNDGALSNSGEVTCLGNCYHNAGATYSGNGTIVIQGALNNSSNNAFAIETLEFNNGSFINNGTGAASIGTVYIPFPAYSGTIQGNAISLTAANVEGPLAINSVITGAGSLTKTGAGSLTLSGANTYLGGTIINGGTVSVGSDGNLGDAAGALTFGGGTLLTTNSFTSNRSVTLNAGGGTFNTSGNSLTLSGNMSGVGALTKVGAGTLTLSGTNNYSGGTTVTAGILQGDTTSLQGPVANNSQVVFNQGVAGAYTGNMTGTGSLTKIGLGTLILSGTNNYTGGTTVTAGILQGNTTSLQGSITNNSLVTFDQSINGAYTGVMTGAGSLTKSGAGTLVVAGSNTYSGGTTVSGGVLQGTATSLQGNILNNASVVFDQAGNGTYAGVMSGTGSLAKLGIGTLYLNGANTYTGGTNITGGALSVNGSILGPVNIGTAGILKGSGSINGSVTNSGMLAPGNSIGTTTINGNYTHNAGAVYQVEANAAGQADKLNVTGTATLNGGTVAVLAENGRYRMKTDYTILSAGSVQGSFSSVTSNLAFLTPSLRYDPSNVYLSLTRNSTSFADVAYTQNQRAVAMTLDRISPIASGDMMTVMDNLLMVSDSGARSAYNQMGGLSHTAMAGATFSSLNQYMGTLSGRMETYSLGKTADAGRAQYASSSQIVNDASPAGKAIEQAQWDIWMRGYGTKGYHRGDDISSNYDHWSGGSTIGIDRRLSREILFGVSAGYSHSELTMNDLPEKGKADSYQLSLYGAYRGDALYVNSQLSYGYNRYDISRSIMFGGINRIAESDYSGHAISAAIEAGYRIRTSCMDIIPLVGFQAAYLSRNSFAEHGADSLNLIGGKESTNSLISAVGFRLTKDYTVGSGILTPEVRAKWLHEFSNDSYVLNAAFSGYPVMAFSVRGDRPDRDSAAVGLGVNYAPQKNLSLYLTYDTHLASDHTEHAGSVGVRYTW